MSSLSGREWALDAIRRIEADFQRSADTHLIPLKLSGWPDIDFYLKDESSHPTGSLKHRLARSLFLHALCNGWLKPGSTVVEASSGSTAISEAYFAKLLGLPFIAVMPSRTSRAKIEAIESQGGQCHLVDDPQQIYAQAEGLARSLGGHYMDQFTFAERATDWRANNNIAESIFEQMALESHAKPVWIVAGAGTGGTLATLGRFVRYRRHQTRVCGVDPEFSAFFKHCVDDDPHAVCDRGSRIEGIGRPRVELSFIPQSLDALLKVPDRWSLGAMLALGRALGRQVGPSTGSNWVAALACAQSMAERSMTGSIVTLLCDGGERYRNTVHCPHWREQEYLDCEREEQDMLRWMNQGTVPERLAESLWVWSPDKQGAPWGTLV